MNILTKPEIKTLALDVVKPHPENPREIDAKAFSGLKESIKKFGIFQPIVVSKKTMHIVSGHQRYTALKEMGAAECICILLDISPEDEKVLLITANNPKLSGKFTAELGPMIEALRRKLPTSIQLDLRLEELRNKVTSKSIQKPELKIKQTKCPHCNGSGKISQKG